MEALCVIFKKHIGGGQIHDLRIPFWQYFENRKGQVLLQERSTDLNNFDIFRSLFL